MTPRRFTVAIVKRSAKQSHKRASIKILHLDGVFEGRNKARMRYPVLTGGVNTSGTEGPESCWYNATLVLHEVHRHRVLLTI